MKSKQIDKEIPYHKYFNRNREIKPDAGVLDVLQELFERENEIKELEKELKKWDGKKLTAKGKEAKRKMYTRLTKLKNEKKKDLEKYGKTDKDGNVIPIKCAAASTGIEPITKEQEEEQRKHIEKLIEEAKKKNPDASIAKPVED